MVEIDGGDDRDVAVGGVRRVPRTAHADLDHRDVDGCVGERDEREHCQQFEEGERGVAGCLQLCIHELDERLDLVPRVGDRRVGDGLAVDHDPLGETGEMRTREQARSQAVCPHEALDDPARGRLAVRSRDVDDAIGALRVVEQFEHAPRALDAGLHPALALALEQRRVDGVGAGDVASGHDEAPIRVTATWKPPLLA